MYDINNLDYVEFEEFCCDYMERITNKKFKLYAVGKDGGIDIESIDGNIICQCKRYSDNSSLTSVCEKEVVKLKKLNFNEYYLLTSRNMSAPYVNKIYNIFKEYMEDKSHIISKQDINRFLKEEKNKDILQKHHKLWLLSSNILSLYLEKYVHSTSKYEMEKAKKERKYFVETKPYYDALKIIDNKRILLLTGEPGVGKSITSRMIIYYMLTKYNDYKFIFTPTNNVTKIIESMDDDAKEILFMDDFLGQTCDNIDLQNLKEICFLLNMIKLNPNKKIIMNSRITIFNKVKNEENEFNKLLKEINLDEYTISIDDISIVDRARIIYNLLYVNQIPYNEFIIIKEKYNSIIYHKSFNTRIIDYSILQYKENSKNHLYDLIIQNLDNPKDVWKSEFNHIEAIDKIVMYQLYSLGDNFVPYYALKESINNYLFKFNINNFNYTNFNDVVNRLNKSLLTINIIEGKKHLKVLSPSINDYIQSELNNNESLQKKIVSSAIYIEQISKLVFLNENNLNEINNISMIKSYDNIKIKFLNFIYNNCFLCHDAKAKVRDIFKENINNNIQVIFLLEKKLREFYNLNDVINNIEFCSNIFKDADYNQVFQLLQYYYSNPYIFDLDRIKYNFNDIVITSVENKLIEECSSDIESFVYEKEIEQKYKLSKDNTELEIRNEFRLEVEDYLNDCYNSNLYTIIDELNDVEYKLNVDDILPSNVTFNISIDSIIDSDCYDARSYFKELKQEEDNNKMISAFDIFNQNYNEKW